MQRGNENWAQREALRWFGFTSPSRRGRFSRSRLPEELEPWNKKPKIAFKKCRRTKKSSYWYPKNEARGGAKTTILGCFYFFFSGTKCQDIPPPGVKNEYIRVVELAFPYKKPPLPRLVAQRLGTEKRKKRKKSLDFSIFRHSRGHSQWQFGARAPTVGSFDAPLQGDSDGIGGFPAAIF